MVINEFMSWSGCSITSEFIELVNFGPGPMNIGCYIVTNGTYSATIPPNTILQPGQYFLLSGKDSLAAGCGNTDSLVHVNLNWTTCNCTNMPIPTMVNGFLKDGGSANEKIVLLDPNLNVTDAVSRSSPVSTSTPISTSIVSGGCTSKTFDLTTMGISYETINNSTGINNSFARKVDGDCGWVKTTAISAQAPNKTGSTSSASYSFSTLSASQCNGTKGSISIEVTAPNVSSLFPMNYTLGYDADSNSLFNGTDIYTYGVDSSASAIDINNLKYGRYRITVASTQGCNLKTYDFYIFNCYGILLPLKLLYFQYSGIKDNRHIFKYRLNESNNLKSLVLEASNGGFYNTVTTVNNVNTSNETTISAPISGSRNFRLRLIDNSGVASYSQAIKVDAQTANQMRYWLNPLDNKLFIQINLKTKDKLSCTVFNANGVAVKEARQALNAGNNNIIIATSDLSTGVYFVRITGATLLQPGFFRFVK